MSNSSYLCFFQFHRELDRLSGQRDYFPAAVRALQEKLDGDLSRLLKSPKGRVQTRMTNQVF